MVVRTRMSVAAFEREADRFGPCELIRGEVIFLSPAGWPHGAIVNNVAFALTTWARRTKRGRVLAGEAGVVTESIPGTVRGADVAYFSFKRLPRSRTPDGFSRIPPDLAVEVIGKGQGWQAMVEKAGEYLRMGVDRVWIIDPKTRRLHVLRPDAEPEMLSEKATVSDTKVLPGFRCRVRDLFA